MASISVITLKIRDIEISKQFLIYIVHLMCNKYELGMSKMWKHELGCG